MAHSYLIRSLVDPSTIKIGILLKCFRWENSRLLRRPTFNDEISWYTNLNVDFTKAIPKNAPNCTELRNSRYPSLTFLRQMQ